MVESEKISPQTHPSILYTYPLKLSIPKMTPCLKPQNIHFPKHHFWHLCQFSGGCTPLETKMSYQWIRKLLFSTTCWMGTVSCKECILPTLQNVWNLRWGVWQLLTHQRGIFILLIGYFFFPNHGSGKITPFWRQTTHLLFSPHFPLNHDYGRKSNKDDVYRALHGACHMGLKCLSSPMWVDPIGVSYLYVNITA